MIIRGYVLNPEITVSWKRCECYEQFDWRDSTKRRNL